MAKRIGVWCVVALSAFGQACDEAPAQAATPPPPTVVVAEARTRVVDLYTENVGQLDGYVNAEIRARVRGFLHSQRYRDGSQVKAGQLLFTIDPVEYQAALESARGTLARARAALANAQTQYGRSVTLQKNGTIAQRALDDATAALADAAGQDRAAQAAVRQAELNLGYTRLHSPIDGVAGLALVRVGNLVGQDGPTRLTTVSTLDPMRMHFPLSERAYLESAKRYKDLSTRDIPWARAQLAALASGKPSDDGDQGVELVLADDRTYPLRGLIISADREINPSTGTIQVEALFPNPDGMLRPGQYGRVRIRSPRGDAPSLVVAQKSLLEVQGTYSVAVVKADNKVELRRVDVGPTTGEERVITKGLVAGEKIVVEGVQKVADGAEVKPVSARAEGPSTAAADAARGSARP
jgi:membrane fusion protein (multidrug efflux system)